jgi:hypothetical protein
MALQPRELNTLVGCSKRLTAGGPVRASFGKRNSGACPVSKPNGSGTKSGKGFSWLRESRGLNAMIQCPIAGELPDDYGMGVVVAAVAAVMPIWLRKCAGRKERKQDKY